VATIASDDIACLIYTSGTGGTPKGVMTTHRNILANCRGAHRVLEVLGLGDEVFLSFLPLSHSYEHTAGMMFPISLGAQIYFAEGADTLAANMLEARPTIMTAVPRLYETLHHRIRLGVERKGGVAHKMFDQAVAVGRKRLLSQAPSMVSGGAPLNPEIGRFFLALGITLLQGYGQTEAGPVISCNSPARIKIDTVGPPIDGVRVRIAEDGEILVAGDNVMKGYWNDPEATKQAFENGWLRTGDVGLIDDDGCLRITDRKRDFIKTSAGEMISPARIEGYLTLEPEIAQVMVFGDRHPYLVAVLVPDPDFVASFATQVASAADLVALAADPAFTKAVGAAVGRVNQALSPIERVRRFIIAAEPFTIANGQMTPTLKIKRHAIREVYGRALDALYDGKGIAA